ncbi:YcaO-like family protein [Streptomyces alboflavus]|uniref:YcaO-like family protein n=1 Tax=Streptomyces alboflavus TaxID=67267 RepID=UPI0004BE74BC|nr:YcaO-like family protein [Streptomyces alboflavus]
MIDFSATLAPENGLASAYAIRPPHHPDEPLWQGLAELHRDRTGADEQQDEALSPTVVGAYGISPSDTLTRAAGEAVERFALYPVGSVGPVGSGTLADSADPADPANPANPADSVSPAALADSADPADPADPVAPADPAHPADSADPMGPTDPVGLANPMNPTDSASLANPVGLAGPANPADPTDPVSLANPVGLAGPANPADPMDPMDPTDSAKLADSTNPADPADPTDPTDPVSLANPVGLAGPANPADPTHPTHPTHSAKLADSTNPADPAGPANPADSVSPAALADSADPADPADPVAPVAPVAPANPAPLENPADPTAPEHPQAPQNPPHPPHPPHPPSSEGRLARIEDLGAAPVLDPTAPGAHLAADDVLDRPLRWYPARWLDSGAPLEVPAGLVDYPARAEDADGFDPSPSGAASGGTREQALRSALLEVVERDAFLTAWFHQLPLRLLDADRFVSESPDPRSPGIRRFRQALDAARALGLSPVLARVPTQVPGVVCTVGVIVDTDGADGGRPLAAVGASASDDPATSAVKALQEALQIRSALRLVQRTHPAPHPSRRPRGDLERAQYFAAPEGVRAVERWVATFTPAETDTTATDAVTVTDLLDALRAQGVRPVAVDLTHRLPDPIRAMGWHAVKVIPVGMQPLRMDDRLEFTWHGQRLQAARARFGSGQDPATADPEPHPLI